MICFTIQDGMRFRSNVRSMGLKCDGIVEKRMGVKKEGMEMTTKSIFDSDNENEENEVERSVSSSKREGSVMVVDDSVNRKKMKTVYDPELYLEAIEKASSEEAKMVERSGTPTKGVLDGVMDD